LLQLGWPGYLKPGTGTLVATLQIGLIHSASAVGMGGTKREFEMATLADFL